MTSSLEELLKKNFVDSQDTVWHTHVSMVQPRGKFQFNRNDLENFWKEYSVNYSRKITGIAEKPQAYTPILVDVDLKIKDDSTVDYGEHLYTNNHVLKTIQIYQSILKDIVYDCEPENLTCVLLEKPIYYITTGDTRYIKNGFHLHFPNLFLSKVDQTVHLIPRVKEAVSNMKLFSDLGITDSGAVIDASCCTVPWLLYGSRKSEDSEPYTFSRVYDANCSVIDLERAFSNYKLYDNEEDLIEIRGKVMYYLPRILSIVPYGRASYEVRSGLEFIAKENLKRKNTFQLTRQASVDVSEALKISEKLLPMLADFRADDRNEWIGIGWVLYSIGDGCSEALDQWLEFSSRSEKYDETKCVYEWERMTKRDKTLGTLKHFAKYDSPELYKEFLADQADPLIHGSLNGSHNDIAKVLYAYFGDEFRCASITSQTWYQFRKEEHRWEEIEGGVFLREHISQKLVADYVEMGKKIYDQIGATQDKAEEAMFKCRRKQVDTIIANLKNASYKNSVMRECMEVFYDRTFKERLDQNPMLIGFKNGVYDLKLNHFRPGLIDDYISKNIPIEYKEFNEADNEVQDVKEFLHKVFPDNSIRTYFMDVYSDIFVGGNSQKKVYMWTGEGDNGKSITQNFFDMMLGHLAIKFNTQYFTGKKTATGAANPELSRAAPPVRHVTMEEPDVDEQLNIGELKKLSGGDTYWARDLFEKGKATREVTPMFTLTFICNKLPKLKHSDKATWNRIRVIPFESTFVPPGEPCPVTFEEQLREKRFPMDRDFKVKIPGMIQAFAWYLLQWRQKVTIRIEPDKVKEATAIYRKQNDSYRQFIDECIIECNSTLTLVEMYAQFKEWFRESFPNMSLPIKNDVKEYFENIWGPCERGAKWKGYRIRTLQDDLDSGDAVLLDESELVYYGEDN